ncbi:beta-galactosidase [Chloropicon primus]|nr:beta-galactosidase [Chloropicon primus]
MVPPLADQTNERENKIVVVPWALDDNDDEEKCETFSSKCAQWRAKVHGPPSSPSSSSSSSSSPRRRLLTRWGEELDPEVGVVHSEYPRPAMVRGGEEDWVCLNGFWQYAVKRIEKGQPPRQFDGDILVPFPIESVLSGVERRVTKDDFLWYRRKFSLPRHYSKSESRLVLHFGAVDWQTIVYINGQAVGEHSGGYDPFEFDITRFLNFSGTAEQEVVVRVYDPTDDGIQPRGKQCGDPFTSKRVVEPLGMWYTPNSGIWQTVWLECVPKEAYIQRIRVIPNVDANTVTVMASVRQEVFRRNHGLFVKVLCEGELVGFASGSTHHQVEISLNEGHKTRLWTPESPFLYDVEVYLHDSIIPKKSNDHVDMVRSYTAMRKVSVGTDVNGVQRLKLNNKNLFQYGVLDQGWWPDGLYAPASEEALKWDIQITKSMGFNMIRKHVKVESQRWYYHCDRMGMLVWQDMPNGSKPATWGPNGEHDYSENSLDPLFAKIFEDELLNCVDTLYNHPCIAVWVPFNEAWGQYNSVEVVSWLEHYDKSRLVWLSGGNDFGVGAAIDRHVYPEPRMPPLDDKRVSVLGEFGGLGHALEQHAWAVQSNSPVDSGAEEEASSEDDAYATFVEWGYGECPNLDSLAQDYLAMLDKLHQLATSGLSAAVYTQFSDVERESNGLVTYDRKFIKIEVNLMKRAHRRLLSRASTIFSRSHMDLLALSEEARPGVKKSSSSQDIKAVNVTMKRSSTTNYLSCPVSS